LVNARQQTEAQPPDEEQNYDEAMEQRMKNWAAIRRRRLPKPLDKPGNLNQPVEVEQNVLGNFIKFSIID
jgi:hypothetical protein